MTSTTSSTRSSRNDRLPHAGGSSHHSRRSDRAVRGDRTASGTRVFWRRLSIGRKPATTPISSREAAALWESLSQNHPFLDGNKRTAFAATYTFLAINDAQLTAEAEQAQAFILRLYEAGTFRFDNLEPWLRRNVKVSV